MLEAFCTVWQTKGRWGFVVIARDLLSPVPAQYQLPDQSRVSPKRCSEPPSWWACSCPLQSRLEGSQVQMAHVNLDTFEGCNHPQANSQLSYTHRQAS